MRKITFVDAFGNWHEDPDPAWLKDLVFNKSDDFWEGATGDASLSYDQDSVPKSGMTLVGRAQHGFMIDHNYNDGEPTCSLVAGQHTGDIVEVFIGGEPTRFWREYFVPKDMAWKAIEYFLESGDRNQRLVWEETRMPEAL